MLRCCSRKRPVASFAVSCHAAGPTVLRQRFGQSLTREGKEAGSGDAGGLPSGGKASSVGAKGPQPAVREGEGAANVGPDAAAAPDLTLEQLDRFKPPLSRHSGAGSDESRKAVKDARYNLAVQRLSKHFTVSDLSSLVQAAGLVEVSSAKKDRRATNKYDLVRLIVTERWGIEGQDVQKVTSQRHGGRQYKRIALPDMPVLHSMLRLVENTTGSSVTLRAADGQVPSQEVADAGGEGRTVQYMVSQQGGRALRPSLLFLGLHELWCTSRWPLLIDHDGETRCADYPLGLRHGLEWMWETPTFNRLTTRTRTVRRETALVSPEPAVEPAADSDELAFDISALAEESMTDAWHVPQIAPSFADRIYAALQELMPRDSLGDWSIRLESGYLCQLHPSPESGMLHTTAEPYLSNETSQRRCFIPEVSPNADVIDHMSWSTSRRLTYRLARIRSANGATLPDSLVRLHVDVVGSEATYRMEEEQHLHLALPSRSLDARIVATRSIPVPVESDWFSEVRTRLEDSIENDTRPSINIDMPHMPDLTGTAADSVWYLESNVSLRRGVAVPPDATGYPVDAEVVQSIDLQPVLPGYTKRRHSFSVRDFFQRVYSFLRSRQLGVAGSMSESSVAALWRAFNSELDSSS